MLYEGYLATEIWKDESKRIERRAAENWRFRHLKSKESQILAAVVANVLQLFLR